MLSYRLSWLGLMNELNKERKTINDRSVKDSTSAAMKFFIFVHSNGYLKKIKEQKYNKNQTFSFSR